MSIDWDALIREAFSNPLDPTNRASAGGTLYQSQNQPYARPASEIVSIQQQNARGLRVIDIEPYLLTLQSFACALPESSLTDVTGAELNSRSGGWGTESDHSPYWRTVEIPVQATFVKVEYLPSRMTDYWQGSFPNGASPRNETISPVGSGVAFQNFTTKYAGSHIILVNFDDLTGAPIHAKHGDCFKMPFNTIYLTVKQWSPRIRLTIGYNSEISSLDERLTNTSLSMSPGNGLLNSPYIHPVPFCITYNDLGGSVFRITTATSSDTEPLMANALNAVNSNGALYGWITDFAFALDYDSGVDVARGSIDLFIADYPVTTLKRRLLSVPFTYRTGLFTENKFSANLAEPLRFGIRAQESLVIRMQGSVSASTLQAVEPYFSLSGYTYGPVGGSGGSFNTTPFVPVFKLTDEVYPIDQAYLGNPRL